MRSPATLALVTLPIACHLVSGFDKFEFRTEVNAGGHGGAGAASGEGGGGEGGGGGESVCLAAGTPCQDDPGLCCSGSCQDGSCTCECPQRQDHDGQPVAAACGTPWSHCGSDGHWYGCTDDGKWAENGEPCPSSCICSFGGFDYLDNPVEAPCGKTYAVCGLDHCWYDCSDGGAWLPRSPCEPCP
jgi:hypothetical protein